MALPEFSLRQLLEAGVHFGHQTHRWNPRMDQYIYGSRNGIHIMDLTQTVPLLDQALNVVRETVSKGGRILFVGTKRQASKAVAEAAERSAQYYMNHRWLGGTLTNWQTVSKSIQRLKAISAQMETGFDGLTKKERLGMEREHAKLHASLNGIAEMGGTPDLLFVIDTNKEALAVAEANKLGIPVIGILDTNSAPEGIDYPIPGNDDAARAIGLYCDLIARSALDGMAAQMGSAGVDIGELVDAPVEEILDVVETSKEVEEETPESVGTKPTLFSEAPSEKDDLKKITGVGPKLEEAMNKLGIYQFAQVASWTNDEIMWVDDSLSVKGRIERDDWVGQVSELIKG
ncbi:MAG: 30S ribosomal protein S2 [Rhodobacterales bacterium]|jgi:small subunit ribosomal protein S2|nr:30S ribosomal protein S2 [Rhodobacterales bacterium]MBT7560567.1 30S ribosomal protein S2 [Rhodobacterales bacterium]MCO4796550.1 30S ribosomal protein S2 [Amylibacter sp.]